MKRDSITAAEYREIIGKPQKRARRKPLPRIEPEVVADAQRHVVEISVPIRIESEMNRRDHWRAGLARKKQHRKAVHYLLAGSAAVLAEIAKSPRIFVTCTRLGPKKLDAADNLRAGFKAAVDEVAAMLGIDDGSNRYQWEYRQEIARVYGAKIRIEAMTETREA